jgi:hypothetical protein
MIFASLCTDRGLALPAVGRLQPYKEDLMRKTQSRARFAPLGGALPSLALLVVAVVMTACVASSAPQATPAAQATQGGAAPSAVAPSAATQPAPQATSATGPSAPFATAAPGSQEAGASASLSPAAKYVTHWKGDPNAKVAIIEISDFQ